MPDRFTDNVLNALELAKFIFEDNEYLFIDKDINDHGICYTGYDCTNPFITVAISYSDMTKMIHITTYTYYNGKCCKMYHNFTINKYNATELRICVKNLRNKIRRQFRIDLNHDQQF